ncbi:MAG: hypothetical protein ACR2J8_05885 [Thermomicrobiales bacterium]
MFELQDRRSALTRFAAGAAAAAVAVREMTTGVAAQAEIAGKKNDEMHYFWKLPWGAASFTKVGSDPLRYDATVGAFGEGSFDDLMSGKKRRIDDKQLERIINKKTNNGKLKGMPQIRLAGINWRVLTAVYVPASKTWNMALRVCDSNPDARPDTTSAFRTSLGDVSAQGTDGGCVCGCGRKCYVCKNGNKGCGDYCSEVCSSGCQ